MKIAICLPGQLRTGLLTSDNILRYVGNFSKCDFFIHTWNINTPSPGIEITDLDAYKYRTEIPNDDLNKYREK